MSTTFSLNRLLAGAAGAIALTLAAGPALAAQPTDMGRVEIRGKVLQAPVRYDVRANCHDIDDQLQSALQRTWERESRYGHVNVQFVMENGNVSGVQANGISHRVARDVRVAVNRLYCGPQVTASARIYRFDVAFVDPDAPRDTLTASAKPAGGTRAAPLIRRS
jgi:hypothetical protein